MTNLRNFKSLWVAVLLVGVVAGSTCAKADDLPEVAGVFGAEGADEGALLAVRVPIPAGMAIVGIDWYNNDAGTVFDRVLVGTGYVDSPGLVTDFSVVATQVAGLSSNWSSLVFDMPVAPSLDALYVVFSIPSGDLVGRGAGGGPGIGYCDASGGLDGWLSDDSEVWAKLHTDYGFAVRPDLVPVDESMFVKSLGGGDGETPMPVEPFLAAGPNPFNPTVEIRFGLKVGAQTRMDIYDLRGRRVRRLIDEYRTPGTHRVVWHGRDEGDRGVASGVYVMVLESGDLHMKQQVSLVR